MRLILLTAGGRAGSDFFHSLLDGHSQILQFPGYLKVDKNLKLILETKDLKRKTEFPKNPDIVIKNRFDKPIYLLKKELINKLKKSN